MAACARHQRADDVGERDDRDREHRPTPPPPPLLHAEERVVGTGHRTRREEAGPSPQPFEEAAPLGLGSPGHVLTIVAFGVRPSTESP